MLAGRTKEVAWAAGTDGDRRQVGQRLKLMADAAVTLHVRQSAFEVSHKGVTVDTDHSARLIPATVADNRPKEKWVSRGLKDRKDCLAGQVISLADARDVSLAIAPVGYAPNPP